MLCNCGRACLYIGGKPESHPELITMYIAYYPQKWYSDISVLLQLQHNHAFSFGSLDFLYMQEYSAPGKNIYYTIECGVKRIAIRIACVQNAKLYGLRSNNDFTHYVRSTFDYYCTNYSMIVLPSHNSRSKIVHTQHMKV